MGYLHRGGKRQRGQHRDIYKTFAFLCTDLAGPLPVRDVAFYGSTLSLGCVVCLSCGFSVDGASDGLDLCSTCEAQTSFSLPIGDAAGWCPIGV